MNVSNETMKFSHFHVMTDWCVTANIKVSIVIVGICYITLRYIQHFHSGDIEYFIIFALQIQHGKSVMAKITSRWYRLWVSINYCLTHCNCVINKIWHFIEILTLLDSGPDFGFPAPPYL